MRILQLGLRAAAVLFSALPLDWLDLIARLAGGLFFLLSSNRRQTVRVNLRRVLPAETTQRINQLTRRTFVNFIHCFLDLIKLTALKPHRICSLVTGDPHPTLNRARSQQRGVVVLTLHLGNWDLAGVYLAACGYPVIALVEPTPKAVLDFFTSIRECTGMRTYPLRQAAAALQDTMRHNGLLALVADRDISGQGRPVRLFQSLRRIPGRLPEFIVRSRLPVIFGYLALNPAGGETRYRMVVQEPTCFSNTADFERFLIRNFESTIRQYPDQWFVFQNEWLENAA